MNRKEVYGSAENSEICKLPCFYGGKLRIKSFLFYTFWLLERMNLWGTFGFFMYFNCLSYCFFRIFARTFV